MTKRINLNVNAQYSGIWVTGTYNSQFFTNKGIQGNGDLFARWSLDHGFTINVDVDYQSGSVLLQGKTTHWTWSTYNVTKELLNKKFILDFTQSTYNQFYYRQFRFAVNYKFGQLKVSDKLPTE